MGVAIALLSVCPFLASDEKPRRWRDDRPELHLAFLPI